MKKIILFALILAATGGIQACNSSNGDRAKSGDADTVGQKTNPVKTGPTSVKDTLKH